MDRSAGDHRIIGQFGVACALLAIGVGYSDISSRVAPLLMRQALGSDRKSARSVHVDGDALPKGLVARLGTKRYRPTIPRGGLSFLTGTHSLAMLTENGFLDIGMPTRAG